MKVTSVKLPLTRLSCLLMESPLLLAALRIQRRARRHCSGSRTAGLPNSTVDFQREEVKAAVRSLLKMGPQRCQVQRDAELAALASLAARRIRMRMFGNWVHCEQSVKYEYKNKSIVNHRFVPPGQPASIKNRMVRQLQRCQMGRDATLAAALAALATLAARRTRLRMVGNWIQCEQAVEYEYKGAMKSNSNYRFAPPGKPAYNIKKNMVRQLMMHSPAFVNDETSELVLMRQLSGFCFDAHYAVTKNSESKLNNRYVNFKPMGGEGGKEREDFTGVLGAGAFGTVVPGEGTAQDGSGAVFPTAVKLERVDYKARSGQNTWLVPAGKVVGDAPGSGWRGGRIEWADAVRNGGLERRYDDGSAPNGRLHIEKQALDECAGFGIPKAYYYMECGVIIQDSLLAGDDVYGGVDQKEEHFDVLVMERLGHDLTFHYTAARKAGLPGLNPLAALQLLRDGIHRLQHIHDAGWVHRDLKPENLLLGHDGADTAAARDALWLIDFGIARPVRAAVEASSNRQRSNKQRSNKHRSSERPAQDASGMRQVHQREFCGEKNGLGRIAGTLRYVSIAAMGGSVKAAAHSGIEKGRKDDLEEFGYAMLAMLGSRRNEDKPQAGSAYVSEVLPWQNTIVDGVDVSKKEHLDTAKRNMFVLEGKLALRAARGEGEWADLPTGEGHNLPLAAMPRQARRALVKFFHEYFKFARGEDLVAGGKYLVDVPVLSMDTGVGVGTLSDTLLSGMQRLAEDCTVEQLVCARHYRRPKYEKLLELVDEAECALRAAAPAAAVALDTLPMAQRLVDGALASAVQTGEADADVTSATGDCDPVGEILTQQAKVAFVQAEKPAGYENLELEVDGSLTTMTVEVLKIFLKANDCDAEGFERFFPPMKAFTNGLEWLSAPMTGWDRNVKAALKKFLNKMGHDAGDPATFKMGTEWDAKGTTALQNFLNKNGATLEVTGTMGLSNSYGSNWAPSETVKALQTFLNEKAFK